jgi:hypothetical protein
MEAPTVRERYSSGERFLAVTVLGTYAHVEYLGG